MFSESQRGEVTSFIDAQAPALMKYVAATAPQLPPYDCLLACSFVRPASFLSREAFQLFSGVEARSLAGLHLAVLSYTSG